MIINVTIDTDSKTFEAVDEDNEIFIDYQNCHNPEKFTIEEIINDFLT